MPDHKTPRERLEILDGILAELRDANRATPILVEGPRDAAALNTLGFEGEIRSLHGPGTLVDEADRTAEEVDALILLTDWDRTGGTLARRMRENLKGRVDLDVEFRRRIAKIVGVKCVEDLPAFRRYLLRLSGRP